jgi:prolyl-tRNA synthetase
MRYSQLFAKSIKAVPADEVSINAKYLLQAGFIDKLMSGSYSLLPMGRRVERKIEQIIREEMDKTGAQEVLMPLLHPKEIWNETGRWDYAKDIMYQFKKNEREYALSFTHEEIVMDLIRKHTASYKDFPVKIYHFSTKFRNELRAKSGILRGREFLMKDLYSAHVSEKDLQIYYWEVADAYLKIFKRIGLNVKIVEAAGGVFTENITHEFQQLAETGEDTIYYCPSCDFAQNNEIAKVKEGEVCPKCSKGEVTIGKSIEVGNIFPLGTKYSEKMKAFFTDKDGSKKPIWFASYGIGPTRVMGTLVEVYHDDKGIIWPESVAPYQVHLIHLEGAKLDHLEGGRMDSFAVKSKADEIYEKLKGAGIEVLYDDREVSAGEKFADADLIGIPVRLVVSAKTLRQAQGGSGDKIEWKRRSEKETELLPLEDILKRLKITLTV